MSINSQTYAEAISDLLPRVMREQAPQVSRAADLITEAIRADGVVHAFGSGHSQALAMEIAGRAGGLVPTNRLSLRDIVLYGGEPASVLDDVRLERDPSVAERVLALAPVRDGDVFVIASSSGVNGVVVELARLVKERGHGLIAITSLDHTGRVEPRHPSGKRLCDLADVVVDNGAPYGDAALPLPGGGATGAVSSVTGAALAQMIVTEVVGRLIEAGEAPPVYLSMNVPGGDEHNNQLEARYAGRIRRGA
ncbi:sugar isomerase domain-containing protein [Planosporangium mesophilum]|nr:SIS domain-containing protein [Planosporangium mesophilum]NJC83252.1 SIS domain-containing protein [Planosporangium mesophilum]